MKTIFTLLLTMIILICSCTPREKGFIEIYFCPEQDCEQALSAYVLNSSEIECAFYDLGLENLIDTFNKTKSNVLIFKDNYNKFGISVESKGLMHNKFCVFNKNIIMTGSFNPTYNGNNKNNNNIIIIQSKTLAKNYLEEFYEIKNQKPQHKTKKTQIIFNNKIIENYFCPEDNCKKEVIDELKKANETIKFLIFSFTDKEVAEVLINKSENILVKGVIEKKRINMQYNVFHKLNQSKVKVFPDNNSGTMHHKIFIIDDKVVITGSYNPTKSANEKNDENILIIHDKLVAEIYNKEFNKIISKTTNY